MTLNKSVQHTMNQPLGRSARTLLALILSPIIFYLGIHQYQRNDFFMAIWERDTSNFWHFLTNFGHTQNVILQLPTGVIGLIATLVVSLLVLKKIVFYTDNLSFHLLLLVLLDFLVVAILVNIFVFSGSTFELLYFGGAFLAGAFIFGARVTSQTALLALVALILVRLFFVESLFLYTFFIPILALVYFILRAPFESETYQEEMKKFSLSKFIGRP
jgi:hypothetical protein